MTFPIYGKISQMFQTTNQMNIWYWGRRTLQEPNVDFFCNWGGFLVMFYVIGGDQDECMLDSYTSILGLKRHQPIPSIQCFETKLKVLRKDTDLGASNIMDIPANSGAKRGYQLGGFWELHRSKNSSHPTRFRRRNHHPPSRSGNGYPHVES